MSVRLVTASCNYSTSGGSNRVCTGVNMTVQPDQNSQWDDVNTTRNGPNFTGMNGKTISGVAVALRFANKAGTITIKLQKGGVDVSGASFSTTVNATNFPVTGWAWFSVQFTTPHLADTSTYRIVISCTSSGSTYWMRDATAGNYSFVTYDDADTSSAIASGDTIIVDKNVTLTVDANATTAPQTAGRGSISLGDGATLSIPNPGSPITLALGTGVIHRSSNANVNVGSVGTPVSSASVTISSTASNTHGLIEANYVLADGTTGQGNIKFYGNNSSSHIATIGAASGGSNAVGQAVVTFSSSIPVTWIAGDTVKPMCADKNGGDTNTYTILTRDSASQITLTSNISGGNFIQNGALINLSEAARVQGILIQSTNLLYFNGLTTSGGGVIGSMVVQGVYAINCQISGLSNVGAATIVDGYTSYWGSNGPLGFSWFGTTAGTSFNNVVCCTDTTGTTEPDIYGTGLTVSNIYLQGSGGAGSHTVQCNASTFNNIVYANGTNVTTWNSIWWAGSGNTISNLYLIGTQHGIGSTSSASALSFSGGFQRTAFNGTSFANAVNITFNNFTFGVGSSNVTSDIHHNSIQAPSTATFSQVICNNCNLGSKGVNTTQYKLTNNGSYLEFHNYNGTTGDHRTWKTRGLFVTPSPYTALTETSTTSTALLSHQFALLSQTIASKQHTLVLVGNILSAYYAGTFTLPKVDIYTDGNVATPAATAQLAATTGDQTVVANFTPSTSNNQVILDFQTKTNAAGSNADATWKSATILQRIYGNTFTSLSLGISETLTYPIATMTTPVTNPFITVTNPVTVAAYTGISINHSTQTATISSNHTEQELYDYSQYNLTLNPTNAEWLTTIDGANYTSTYNIVINTGVTLTGTSGHNINLGSKTLTLTGTAALSGITVTDSTGTVLSVTLSGLVTGSLYEIHKTSGGAVLGSGTVSGTTVTFNYKATASTPYTYVIRLFGYLEVTGIGTIGTTNVSIPISQAADPNTASYPAGVATDFTINASTGVIAHASGTTVYTVRNLYNYQMDYMANSARMQNSLKMSAQTPFDFTLINSATISDADHNYLKGGSIVEASGNTLWANVYTIGTTSGTQLYIDQNGSTLSGWWGTGDIDVLLKVKTGGSFIASGIVSVRSHRYTYLYDRKSADLSNGGRTATAVSNPTDSNNQTASGTVAAYAITETDGLATHDIGDGAGAQPYNIAFNAGGKTIQQVYEWFKYITRDASGGTVNGVAGELYQYASGTSEVLVSPLGTFAGGKLFGARGIWISNVATADALNYTLTDNNNATHTAPTPPVALTGTGIVAGSRIQVYDVTSSTQLDNSIVSGTTYSLTGITSGHTLRIRLTYVSGVTAKKFWTTNVIAGTSGASFIASQVDDAIYIANGIDGSTVTECSVSGATIKVFLASGTTTTSIQRVYNWFQYILFTSTGLTDQDNYIIATDITNYTFYNGLQFKNLGSTALTISGGYFLQNTSSDPLDCYDQTGGPIFMAYPHVVGFAYSSGSGLSPAQDATLTTISTNAAAALKKKEFIGLK